MNDNNQNQTTEAQERVTGTVKWYDSMKAYGFIAPDDGQGDIFVHKNDTNGLMLREGDRVSFVIKQGPKGKNAADVQLIKD